MAWIHPRRPHGVHPLNAYLRGAAATLVIGLAGAWNGPAVWVLAVTTGLSFFDLGRRDHGERRDATNGGAMADATFAPDSFAGGMQLSYLAILALGAWDHRAPDLAWRTPAFQHIGILSLEFHVDKLSRPLL